MIRLEGLTKSYPSKIGRQYIFRDLNFEFPTENNVAILGKNGAGKSTLFMTMTMTAKQMTPTNAAPNNRSFIRHPLVLVVGSVGMAEAGIR